MDETWVKHLNKMHVKHKTNLFLITKTGKRARLYKHIKLQNLKSNRIHTIYSYKKIWNAFLLRKSYTAVLLSSINPHNQHFFKTSNYTTQKCQSDIYTLAPASWTLPHLYQNTYTVFKMNMHYTILGYEGKQTTLGTEEVNLLSMDREYITKQGRRDATRYEIMLVWVSEQATETIYKYKIP